MAQLAKNIEVRAQVDAELALGVSPRKIAEKYKVGYGTILLWQKKIKEQNNNLETVMAVDANTLQAVADKVKENAPKKVVKQIDNLVDGVTNLQQLEPKFNSMVLKLLEKAEQLAEDDELTVKDWSLLSAGIGALYANIFNKAGVNVNVLNQNQVSGEKMSMFKATLRDS